MENTITSFVPQPKFGVKEHDADIKHSGASFSTQLLSGNSQHPPTALSSRRCEIANCTVAIDAMLINQLIEMIISIPIDDFLITESDELKANEDVYKKRKKQLSKRCKKSQDCSHFSQLDDTVYDLNKLFRARVNGGSADQLKSGIFRLYNNGSVEVQEFIIKIFEKY